MNAPAAKRPDIETLMATLAKGKAEAGVGKGRALSGPERAAVLMLSLGEQYGAKVWALLDDDDLRTLSVVMSTLGTVESNNVEELLLEFVGRLSASGAVMGNYDTPSACCSNICRRSASPASWTKSEARPAATCGRSSPTSRKRCSPII
jgi:hypothetical protein